MSFRKACTLHFAAFFLALAVSATAQQAVPTSIAYQGSLEESGAPANGVYDLSFQLFDGPDSASGSPVGTAIVTQDVNIVDGLFNVTLDFGATAFEDEARWLEIGVRGGDWSTAIFL